MAMTDDLEAFITSYKTTRDGVSGHGQDVLRDQIARRLAAAGASDLIRDPNVQRLARKAEGRYKAFTAQNLVDAVALIT